MTLNTQQEREPSRPDYVSNVFGIAIWKNKDKNGNDYLSVQIPLLGVKANCFPSYSSTE